MTTILSFFGFAVMAVMLGTQCEKTNQVKREYKARMKDLKQKEKAIKYSDKKAKKRQSHEEQVSKSRDECFKNPKNCSGYMGKIQDRYRQ